MAHTRYPASGGGTLAVASVGSSPAAEGASVSGSTLTLQPADATHPGVVTTGSQTLAGAKTFSSAITSSVASGSNAISLTTGARVDFGSGGSDYMYSDGTGLVVPSTIQVTGLYIGSTPILYDLGSFKFRLMGFANNNLASSIGVTISSGTSNLTTAGAKIASCQNNATEKSFIDKDGNYEVVPNGGGVYLRSPDGTRYQITVANGGAVTSTAA